MHTVNIVLPLVRHVRPPPSLCEAAPRWWAPLSEPRSAGPAQRAPRIGEIRSPAAQGVVAPGEVFGASVRAGDPDGDTLGYQWVISNESQVISAGGDPERRLREYPELTLTAGPRATFRAPSQPGEYRLFVTVRDGTGRAATANTPFKVE